MSWSSVVDSEQPRVDLPPRSLSVDELLEQLKLMKMKLEEIIAILEGAEMARIHEAMSGWDELITTELDVKKKFFEVLRKHVAEMNCDFSDDHSLFPGPSDWDNEYSEAIEEGVEDAIAAWSDERAKRALLDTWYDEDEEEEEGDDDCGLDCFENVLDCEVRSWADMIGE